MTEPVQLPIDTVLRTLLMARGARFVRVYEFGEVYIIRTEEPYANDEYGTHLSISAQGRNPTWEEQRDAVWAICPDVTFASYIPPKHKHGTLPGSHVFHWFEVLPVEGYIEQLGDWL